MSCIEAIEKTKIVTVIRGVYGKDLENLLSALFDEGIRAAEITFDQSGAVKDEETAREIKAAVKQMSGKMHIGAGTVLYENQVNLACGAGAEYIVSPDTNEKIISLTKKMGMISVPGALTPTEAQTAFSAGADFVKLFPAGCMGKEYLKAVALPLSHIKFLAVGGINAGEIKDYLACGAAGFGISSGIVDKKLIAQGDFNAVARRAREYIEEAKG